MARNFYLFEIKFKSNPAGFYGTKEHRSYGFYDTDEDAIKNGKEWATECNAHLDLTITRFEDSMGGGRSRKIYEDTFPKQPQQPSVVDRLALTQEQKQCLENIYKVLKTASELGLEFVMQADDTCDVFAYNGKDVENMRTDLFGTDKDGNAEYKKVDLEDLAYVGDNPIYWMMNNESIYVKMKK